MTVAIEIEWRRCPDGFALHDYGGAVFDPTKTLLGQPPSGLYVRPRSSKREALRFLVENAADSIALRFLKAESDEALLTFLSFHGLPGGDGVTEDSLDSIRDLQQRLRLALALQKAGAETAAQVFTGPRVRMGLTVGDPEQPPMLALRPETLAAFMVAEVAVLLAGAGTVLTCTHCGGYFVAGSGRTGRSKRADSTYCSANCRKTAYRFRAQH